MNRIHRSLVLAALFTAATTLASAADTSTLVVKTVDSKVTAVSTDLNSTKEELKMVQSEIGTLIARNHDEIGQLRREQSRAHVVNAG